MASDIPDDDSESFGSLSDGDIGDEALQSDTWIEELECALLADCDPATLKKISEGKRIPSSLRPDYWRTLLALNDAGKVKLTTEYDLPNQDEIRQDCEKLVEQIAQDTSSEPLTDADKLRLKSDFESTLTTYVKARPELYYVRGNGWTDILKVLHNLELNDTQMYQMFFRIVDRYIPRDLSPPPPACNTSELNKATSDLSSKNDQRNTPNKKQQQPNISKKNDTRQKISANKSGQQDDNNTRKVPEKSIQAYHLLRLLIQYHDPELCSILDSRKVIPNLYVKDWFCSLFARSCSPKLALYIWDMHFKMADPFLIFFAAIVMVANASDELKKANMDQTAMLNVLRSMPGKLEEDDIEDLYYLVSNHYTNSTPRSIRSYSHLFFMDTFGSTYSGNESPEDSPTLVDVKTTRLTNSLDLSQYLCLPIVPAEIFALDTIQQRSSASSSPSRQSPSSSSSSLRYFLVDCRPAEQYNAGHLTKAFHLDCSLMLREPSSFATAVQALLEIQRQVVASKSNTGGQHLCFIGSGQEEEDQYVNMVVASFLQKYQKYVSIVFGGFDAIHDYVKTKSELRDSFNKFIVDHNEDLCKACCSKTPEGLERLRLQNANKKLEAPSQQHGLTSSAQSLFATTTNFFKGTDKSSPSNAFSKLATNNPQATATANMIAQSGASMFDKFTNAFISKSSVIKDKLVETLNTTNLPSPTNLSASVGSANQMRSHVSSQDKLGPRYTGGQLKYVMDDLDELTNSSNIKARKNAEDSVDEEPCQEVQIESWQKENKIIALYKCAQIKGSMKYPGFIGLTKTHLWILREIPHNKGFVSIAAKRPLEMVVQITSKRRQPDFIIFRYGYANNTTVATAATTNSPAQSTDGKPGEPAKSVVKGPPTIIASDHLQIPQAFEVIRLIKHEIVRIMDESSKVSAPKTCAETTAVKESAPIDDAKSESPLEETPKANVDSKVSETQPKEDITPTEETAEPKEPDEESKPVEEDDQKQQNKDE